MSSYLNIRQEFDKMRTVSETKVSLVGLEVRVKMYLETISGGETIRPSWN